MDTRFGRLRELLHDDEEHRESWRAICALLEATPPAEAQPLIDYARGVLRGWRKPQTPPPAWIEAALRGHPPRAWEIARAITLDARSMALLDAGLLEHVDAIDIWFPLPTSQLERLLASSLLAGIEHIWVGGVDSETLSRILDACEALKHLTVTRIIDAGVALAQHPRLTQLHELTLLSTDLRASDWDTLARGGRLGNLRRLCVDGQPIERPQLAAVLASLSDQVVDLSLRGAGLSSEALEAIRPLAGHLERLDLSGNPLYGRTLHGVRMPSLRRLTLDGVHLEGASHDSMMTWDLPELTGFHASRSSVDPRCLEAIAAEHWPKLTRLTLISGALDDRQAATLARVDPRVKLALSRNRIGPHGAAQLAQRPRTLCVDNNPIGDDGLEALLASAMLLDAGYALDLSRCMLGPRALGILARWPHLGACRDLKLGGNAIAGTLHQLGSADLSALRQLDLSSSIKGDDDLRALAGLSLPALTTLRLGEVAEAGAAGVEALLGAAWTPTLEVLDLEKAAMGKVSWAALAGKRCSWRELQLRECELRSNLDGLAALKLPRLVALRLSHNPLDDASCWALARANWLGQLRCLDLGASAVDHAGLQALLGAGLDQLEELELGYCAFTTSISTLLRDAPCLPKLRRLGLSDAPLDDLEALLRRLEGGPVQWLRVSRTRPQGRSHTLPDALDLPCVEWLALSGNDLDDDAHRRLGQWRMPALESLELSLHELYAPSHRPLGHPSWAPALSEFDADLGDHAVAHLIAQEGSPFRRIERLWLNHQGLGDDFAHNLARASCLAWLTDLSLSHNPISDEALAQLLSQPRLRRLRYLALKNTEAGEATWAALLDAPFLPALNHLGLDLPPSTSPWYRRLTTCPRLSPKVRWEITP